MVFVAFKKISPYRKPSTTMMEHLLKYIPNINLNNSFYCGDAAGRQGDHSDDDIMFAKNIQR